MNNSHAKWLSEKLMKWLGKCFVPMVNGHIGPVAPNLLPQRPGRMLEWKMSFVICYDLNFGRTPEQEGSGGGEGQKKRNPEILHRKRELYADWSVSNGWRAMKPVVKSDSLPPNHMRSHRLALIHWSSINLLGSSVNLNGSRIEWNGMNWMNAAQTRNWLIFRIKNVPSQESELQNQRRDVLAFLFFSFFNQIDWNGFLIRLTSTTIFALRNVILMRCETITLQISTEICSFCERLIFAEWRSVAPLSWSTLDKWIAQPIRFCYRLQTSLPFHLSGFNCVIIEYFKLS